MHAVPGTGAAADGPAVGHGAETGDGEDRFTGREIPAGAFADDDGSTPPAVAAAIAQWRADAQIAPVVAALVPSRLLVALMSVLDSATEAGVEKDSHMAAAMIQRADGRTALVAFTDAGLLRTWQPTARPLPVTAVDAARAALGDGASAILLDGEVVITGPALWALAEGRELAPPATDPAVLEVVAKVVAEVLGPAGLPTVHAVAAGGAAPEGAAPPDITVLLDRAVVADRSAVAALAQTLGAEPVLRSRLGRGLSLGVLADED